MTETEFFPDSNEFQLILVPTLSWSKITDWEQEYINCSLPDGLKTKIQHITCLKNQKIIDKITICHSTPNGSDTNYSIFFDITNSL